MRFALTTMTVIDPTKAEFREIGLDSRSGPHIPNAQSFVMGNIGAAQEKALEKFARSNGAIARTPTSSQIFNCHGLTFASRRTSIDEEDVVRRILREDEYEEISDVQQVLPGDIVVYEGPQDTIPHTAVVIRSPLPGDYGIPLVVSKWGHYREFIHLATRVPQALVFDNLRYYRVTK